METELDILHLYIWILLERVCTIFECCAHKVAGINLYYNTRIACRRDFITASRIHTVASVDVGPG